MQRTKRVNKYKSHLFTNLKDIEVDFENTDSRDGKMMHKALKPIIDGLRDSGVHELQDITMIFKDCGFNNKSTNQIIIFLLNNFQKLNISSRDISKLNKSYRNIIFNSLFREYPNQIIQLIDEFVTCHCPNIHNHDFLIYKLNQLNDQNRNELLNESKGIVDSNNITKINFTDKKNINTNIESNVVTGNIQNENSQYISLFNMKDEEDEFFELIQDNMQFIKF